MSKEKPEIIDYKDINKELAIKVIANNTDFYGIWIEKNNFVMEIHFSPDTRKINLLEGTLGKKIFESQLTEEQKIERSLESLHHALWDYFHQKELDTSSSKPKIK